jgi:signal transduction histidine kinase
MNFHRVAFAQPCLVCSVHGINEELKARSKFSEFVAAILVIAVALIWAERLAWKQITALRQENRVFVEDLLPEQKTEAQAFLLKTNASLARLQRFLFVGLLCLLGSGATIIALAYRRMIGPLRSRLTESRAIIERQEKLASLGVFATGIAHEIRNPLTAIKVRLFSLKQSLRPASSEHEDLAVIENEIDRLELIVKEFLQFARPSEPDLRTIPIGKILQDVQQLLDVEFSRRGIRLTLKIEADGMVRVDPNKFKQALLNLAQNGAEAISGPGEVTLRSRLDNRLLKGEVRPVMIIDVTDTGAGMPEEAQKRLFDPFFTTKEAGTGLGLPIAARIIEKHGGAIECRTAINQGSTFSIVLPRYVEDEREIKNTAG